MNLLIKTKIRCAFFGIAFMLIAVDVFAVCDRSDVSYYLQQGFTNKEVISLCQGAATTGNQENSGVMSHSENKIVQDNYSYTNRYRNLINALDVADININQDDFSFTIPYCVMTGNEDMEGYRDEDCPYVRFRFDMDSMSVVRSEKRSLIKSHEILIRGDIHATLLDDYYEKKKLLILKAIGKPKEIWIEVKRGKNVNQVMSEMREMTKSLTVAK